VAVLALKEERHAQILRILKDRQFITVKQISEMLKVSEMTIRRDLMLLRDRGILTRTHGGAIAKTDEIAFEPFYRHRSTVNVKEKELIGKRALD